MKRTPSVLIAATPPKTVSCSIIFLFMAVAVMAQSPSSVPFPDDTTHKLSNVFTLGEVIIKADKHTEMINRISAENMEAHNRMDVSSALDMLPGVTRAASGSRNEGMVHIRGFNLRQAPVYMDGIPVYIPYDGYVDLARFTTFDIAAIDVAKGFASVNYGPNSLGGAINLISRRPVKRLEYDGAIGLINTNGFTGNINLGANFGKWYIQGSYAILNRKSIRMPQELSDTLSDDGTYRGNSYRNDQKLSFKVGWTPKSNQEYVIGYIYQQGEKGTPVYMGNDPDNSLFSKPRYWQWPRWNKESYYFLSNTAIGSKSYLKARLYKDIFTNTLFSFDDATYTTREKPYAFESYYNDYTYGGSIELGTQLIHKNDMALSLHYKNDVHREHNMGEPVRHFSDNTMMLGLEDVYRINKKLNIVTGLSYQFRQNRKAEDYNNETNTIFDYPASTASNALNGQVFIWFTPVENQKIGIGYAHRTRFATIKDRFSYRMQTAIPNPDLRPETVDNFELNYHTVFYKKIMWQSAVFYSRLTDVMLSVANVQPGKFQLQNFGKADYYGGETQISYPATTRLLLNASYTFTKRKNITEPEVYFTDVPESKFFGIVQYNISPSVRLLTSGIYNASRYSTSYGIKIPAFTIFNAAISYKIMRMISIDAGINNLMDKHYSLVEGYPEEGRNFYVTLRFFNLES